MNISQKKKIRSNLNTLLANYKVFLHKLLKYQWVIQTSEYSILNRRLHSYSEQVEEQIDYIIDRITALGGMPLGTWSSWSRASSLKSNLSIKKPKKILEGFLKDCHLINETAATLIEQATEANDHLTMKLAKEIQIRVLNRINQISLALENGPGKGCVTEKHLLN